MALVMACSWIWRLIQVGRLGGWWWFVVGLHIGRQGEGVVYVAWHERMAHCYNSHATKHSALAVALKFRRGLRQGLQVEAANNSKSSQFHPQYQGIRDIRSRNQNHQQRSPRLHSSVRPLPQNQRRKSTVEAELAVLQARGGFRHTKHHKWSSTSKQI